jgi:arsenate reductase (thioredoxin)
MVAPAKDGPVQILFVCFGNACRSQMAEALARHHGGDRVRAWSAGSHPLGEIIPETYDILLEKGISLEGHWSKGLKDVPVADMDVVVGMGCDVYCPVPEGFKGRFVGWEIPDPYGRDKQSFRSVRDLIEKQVKALLAEFEVDQPSGSDAAR